METDAAIIAETNMYSALFPFIIYKFKLIAAVLMSLGQMLDI